MQRRCTDPNTAATVALAILQRSQATYLRIARNDDAQVAQFNAQTIFNLPFWEELATNAPETLVMALQEAYPIVKKLLFTGLRQQRRREFLSKQTKLANDLQIGRLRSVIQYAIGSKTLAFKLETLIVNGEVVVEPGRIAHVTKHHFVDWFTPQYPKTIPVWMHILTDRAAFFQHGHQRRIPIEHVEVLWLASSHRPPVDDKQAAFHLAISKSPSLERFMGALRNAPKNTASGITGLTYDLMRQWPDEVVKDVYNACCELWERKQIPVEWTRRWVHLIPKVDNPTLDELRPICLLEVVRNLWVGLLVETISDHLYDNDVLAAGQHSGKGRGTDAGSAELSAVLETAKRSRSQLFITSWDIRRAFDSVARGVLQFSWERLGVPSDIAQYLIALDADAIMVVKAPLTMLVHHESGYDGLHENGFTFHPQQGTPQGGNEASLGYVGFSDILLRALSIVGSNDFVTLSVDEGLHAACPNAYVDDLNSVSSSLAGLQRKADIVSAFCSFYCISLNAKKFRAFHVNWGNQHQKLQGACITIHTDDWQPSEVRLAEDGTLTHLGLMRNCGVDDTQQFHELYNKTSVALVKLVAANVSVAAKLMILKTVIYPRIRYIGKGVCWRYDTTSVNYVKFDKLIFAAVRRITNNRACYPTALIDSAAEHECMGIPPISVDCQLAKLADMRRAMSRSPHYQSTMQALVGHVFKSTNQPLVAQQVILQSVKHSDTWWLTSAAEFLQSIGLTLTLNAAKEHHRTVLLARLRPDLSPEVKNRLFLYSIATRQELSMVGDVPSPTIAQLITELQVEPIEYQTIPLRADQLWMVTVAGQRQIHQLMGRHAPGVWQTVRWYSQDSQPRVGSTLVLPDGLNQLVGAGGTSLLHESQLEHHQADTQLLTVTRETYCRNSQHTCVLLDVRKREPQLSVESSLIRQEQAQRPYYQSWLADAHDISVFTDGSFRKTGTTADLLLGHDKPYCQSSIIKRNRDGTYAYLAIINDVIKHTSAFTTELIAQIVALSFTRSEVKTDCQSAILTLQKPKAKSHLLLQLAPQGQADRLTHVYAHPELRKASAEFTPDDRGIFLADAVASDKLAAAGRVFVQSDSIRVSDAVLLKDLSQAIRVPFVSTLDGLLALEPPLQRYQRLQHDKYLLKRDQYKTAQLATPISMTLPWQGTSFAVAATLFKDAAPGARTSQIQRVVYDWHYIGRNKYKATSALEDMRCVLCLAKQENQEHILHHCAHPDMVLLRNEHWAAITQRVICQRATMHTKPLHKALVQLHEILLQPRHFALLFGRVHAAQRSLLAGLPILTASELKSFLASWKEYAAYAIDAYVQRQLLLHKSAGIVPRVYKSHIGSRVLVAREALCGIEATTLLHSDGTKVSTTNFDSRTVLRAKDRDQLTDSNCVILRSGARAKTNATSKTRREMAPDGPLPLPLSGDSKTSDPPLLAVGPVMIPVTVGIIPDCVVPISQVTVIELAMCNN